MNDSQTRPWVGHLFAIISVIAWGTSFLVSKSLMVKLTPVQLMWLRFVIAYPALWIICPKWRFDWKEELQFLLLSLVGNTLYFLAENTALQMTQATNVSILVSTAPILSALLLRFFGENEKLTHRKVFGFVIAFLGVMLVVFNGVFVLKLNPVGDVLALAAALLWAIYGFLARRMLEKLDSSLVTRKLMFYGFLSTTPLLLCEAREIPLQFTLAFGDVCSLLYLGLICSAVCYLLWNRAIYQIGALRTNLYVYFVPLITMLASAVFLKENITATGFIGIVLVIGGMVLIFL